LTRCAKASGTGRRKIQTVTAYLPIRPN